MFGVDVYGAEDFRCSCSEDGTASKGAFYGCGTENRETEECATAREAEERLFESIGRYFHISSQAEQVETQDETGSLERLAESFADVPLARQCRAALNAENIRTYTATGGFHFVTDTESP